ncbi:HU family DNA-binding protein [Pseudolactococcus reticulitermitis]|uniref:HU domain-containing protein n=1 Tax=Pseudolactococcus reticulitermitis TaxID=2025039 RepID=A0A224XAE7_9LACT|nr:HU family DNA-binding protein [Lactococcus reticulitermitis]GAX48240.1 hypothetical protein RsY01_1855 [Lactococcus reticulitermitis]
MAIHYHLVPRTNLQHPEEAPKFYAIAKSVGEVTLADLAEKIAKGSTTVSDTDVLAVLNEVAKLVESEIVEGNIVRFGRLGNFSLSLNSEGAETEAAFNVKLIKGAKIKFKAGDKLVNALATAKFKKDEKPKVAK